ncbi:MAG: extracellular solute-binding protein [Chloroflexota bacterium]|nr:extracellular solute-binding protein [Chloroflexota bacterium]
MSSQESGLRRRTVTRRALLGILTGGAVALGTSACVEEDLGEESTAPPAAKLASTLEMEPTQAPIASPVPGYLDSSRWIGRAMTVASPGVGDYQDALTSAYFDAFAESTGAVVQQSVFAGAGSLRGQVESAEVTWDVAIVPTADVLPLSREELLTPIDYNVVDRTVLYDEIALQHGVGLAFFSTVIVYPKDSEIVPGGWAAFWDLERFGSGRSLRRSPVGTLEFALIAAGVAPEQLYPLDIERAFSSLDKIKTATIFYEDGKQPIEFVASGQVGLASGWNVRAGLPVTRDVVNLQWNEGMLSADSWIVPRGAPNSDVAMSFINFATRAIPSANFSRLQPFGPVNRDAFDLLSPGRAERLPNAPAHRAVQFIEGWNWWADNREAVTERFETWLLTEEEPIDGTITSD